MARRDSNIFSFPLPAGASAGESFPETRSSILAAAAAGKWEPFFDAYLRPCWREVVLACRAHRIPLPDTDDLYQELMVRLLRDAGFSRRVRGMLASLEQDPDFLGNLPERYLKFRGLPLNSARFRTYLKDVIKNLVFESLRKARHQPRQLSESEQDSLKPRIEDSISLSVDRCFLSGAFQCAATRFRRECAAATTRARRRLFEILYMVEVEGRSISAVARKYGLDRSTISSLLKDSRARLAFLLRECTGVDDPAELKALVARNMEELTAALSEAYSASPDCVPPRGRAC
jgi:RNA polymerase sigma factor (sigma-70 family)